MRLDAQVGASKMTLIVNQTKQFVKIAGLKDTRDLGDTPGSAKPCWMQDSSRMAILPTQKRNSNGRRKLRESCALSFESVTETRNSTRLIGLCGSIPVPRLLSSEKSTASREKWLQLTGILTQKKWRRDLLSNPCRSVEP